MTIHKSKNLLTLGLIAAFLSLPPTVALGRFGDASASAQDYRPPPPNGGYGPPEDSYPDYGPEPGAANPNYRDPSGPYSDYRGPAPYPAYRLSPAQLENLLAPVALYPDPLLAQILVAATFADQVEDAARWMRAYNDPYGVDAQPWDVSVKAIAHYPKVLFLMGDRIDWTTALGQAYVEQSADVSAAVQHLRFMAQSAGNLATNDYWEVIPSAGFIAIEPIQPRYIFIPDYPPDVVFFRPATFVFGPAFVIGPWLNCDWDWRGHRIYYHGWHGPRWVERSRPFVRVNHVYVSDRFRSVRVNREIVRRSVRVENLNRFTAVHREANFNDFARRNDRAAAERNFRRDDNRRFDNGRRFENNRAFENRSRAFPDDRGRTFENRSSFRDARPQGFDQRAQRRREDNRQLDDNRREFLGNRPNPNSQGGNRAFNRPQGPENRAFRGSQAARERPANNRPQPESRPSRRNERRGAAL